MRVSTVLSIVFFLTSSLFLSTEALSSGFSLGKKGKEVNIFEKDWLFQQNIKAKAEPAAKEAETEEEAPAKKEEVAEADGEEEESEGTDAPTEETTEAGDTTGTTGDKDKERSIKKTIKKTSYIVYIIFPLTPSLQ